MLSEMFAMTEKLPPTTRFSFVKRATLLYIRCVTEWIEFQQATTIA